MTASISPEEQALLLGLAAALAIGLLVGIERGWHGQQDEHTKRPAGVRTFGLIGLLGGLAGLLAREASPAFLGWALGAFAAAAIGAHVMSVRESGDTGMTTLIAALLTFVLGSMATMGYESLAASTAVVATLLLGFKPEFHRWLAKLDRLELQATLKLLLISIVLLPILPNQGFGPGKVLNPYELWWMVVLIAAISYAGYFAVKMTGANAGIMATGLLAGLASSTALTLQMSRLARQQSSDGNLLGASILVANATLFPRILAIVFVVSPSLVAPLVLPLVVMTLLTALPALLLWMRRGTPVDTATLDFGNPLELGTALRFGLLLTLVMLGAHFTTELFGDVGVFAIAAISGIADLNAITLSVARMSTDSVTTQNATVALILATVSNSLFKAALCGGIGGFGLGLRAGLPLVLACLVGLGLVTLT